MTGSPSPQLENGFFRIANELYDALIAFPLPANNRQCFDFIIRRTYGYNRKEAKISNSEFIKATGLLRQNVYRSLKSLIFKNVIYTDYKIPATYRINKHYTTWKRESLRITGIRTDSNPNPYGFKSESVGIHTPIKDNIKTKDKETFFSEAEKLKKKWAAEAE